MIARVSGAEKRPGVGGKGALGGSGGWRGWEACSRRAGWPEGENLSEMLAGYYCCYLPRKQLVLEVSKWPVCER